MKRSVLQVLVCAAVVAAALPASATPSRVVALGEMSRYIVDDSSVLQYPGLMPTYSHFVFADLGGPSGVSTQMNDLQAAGLNGGAFVRLTRGLHLGVLTSDFQPGEHAAFLTQVANAGNAGNKAGFESIVPQAPLRRYDALAAFEFSSRLAAGLRLSYGSQRMYYLPDENKKNTDGNRRNPDEGGISRFDTTLGASGQIANGVTFDAALSWNHYGVTYVKDGTDPFVGGGGNAVGVSARGRFVLSRYWDIVPQAAWRGSWFGLTEDSTVPVLGDGSDDHPKVLGGDDVREQRIHTRSMQQVDAGAAVVLRASPVAEFWMAAGMQLVYGITSLDFQTKDPGPKYYTQSNERLLSLPYVKFAAEASPLEWLRLRIGAEKYNWSAAETTLIDTIRPKDVPFVTESASGTLPTALKSDFAVYIGASFQLKGFALDLLIDNDFLKRGPYLFTGAGAPVALRASVSYAF